MNVHEQLGDIGLVPVVALERPDDAVPLARALSVGGVGCVEITFRTAAAAEAIRRIADELPESWRSSSSLCNFLCSR